MERRTFLGAVTAAAVLGAKSSAAAEPVGTPLADVWNKLKSDKITDAAFDLRTLSKLTALPPIVKPGLPDADYGLAWDHYLLIVKSHIVADSFGKVTDAETILGHKIAAKTKLTALLGELQGKGLAKSAGFLFADKGVWKVYQPK